MSNETFGTWNKEMRAFGRASWRNIVRLSGTPDLVRETNLSCCMGPEIAWVLLQILLDRNSAAL